MKWRNCAKPFGKLFKLFSWQKKACGLFCWPNWTWRMNGVTVSDKHHQSGFEKIVTEVCNWAKRCEKPLQTHTHVHKRLPLKCARWKCCGSVSLKCFTFNERRRWTRGWKRSDKKIRWGRAAVHRQRIHATSLEQTTNDQLNPTLVIHIEEKMLLLVWGVKRHSRM